MTHTFVLHTKDGVRLPQSAIDTLTFMLETFGLMASPSKALVITQTNQPSTYMVSQQPLDLIHRVTPPNVPRVDCGVHRG